MTKISPAAKAAQDAARQQTGQFGTQIRNDNDGVILTPVEVAGRFGHDAFPGKAFEAVSFGEDRNGAAAPVVTAETMAELAEHIGATDIGDGTYRYTDEDREVGDEDVFVPSADGTYDLGACAPGWMWDRLKSRLEDGRDHPDFGNLNGQVEFDCVFGVDAKGDAVTLPYRHPDAQAYFDDVAHCNDPDSPNGDHWEGVPEGWEVVTGFTGQYGYDGGLMHPSEFLGGGMEAHVRENPGLYVVLNPRDGEAPAEGDPDYDEDTYDPFVDGWVLLHKPTDEE